MNMGWAFWLTVGSRAESDFCCQAEGSFGRLTQAPEETEERNYDLILWQGKGNV